MDLVRSSPSFFSSLSGTLLIFSLCFSFFRLIQKRRERRTKRKKETEKKKKTKSGRRKIRSAKKRRRKKEIEKTGKRTRIESVKRRRIASVEKIESVRKRKRKNIVTVARRTKNIGGSEAAAKVGVAVVTALPRSPEALLLLLLSTWSRHPT
jgi:hypothetical protein